MRNQFHTHCIADNLHSRAARLGDAFVKRDIGRLRACAQRCAANGAARLDLSPGSGRQAAEIMRGCVPALVEDPGLPLALDSPDAAVILAGLSAVPEHAPAPLINSVWNNAERLNALVPPAVARGCPVVGLCMGDRPPQCASERVEQGLRLIDQVGSRGLDHERLWLDVLTLPHGFDFTQARASLEAVQHVTQRWPQCHVVLALSNVGFGYAPMLRSELQCAFLLLARAAGADIILADMCDAATASILRDERPDLDGLAQARLAGTSAEACDDWQARLWMRMGVLLDGRNPEPDLYR